MREGRLGDAPEPPTSSGHGRPARAFPRRALLAHAADPRLSFPARLLTTGRELLQTTDALASRSGERATLLDYARAWETTRERRSHTSPIVDAWVAACGADGRAPWPIHLRALIGFLVKRVTTQNCSSASLPSEMGVIVAQAGRLGHAVSPADRRDLASNLADLQAAMPASVEQAVPITGDIMLALAQQSAPFRAKGNLYAHMWHLVFCIMYAGLLRGQEAVDLAYYGVSVVTVDGRKCVRLYVVWRKTHKKISNAEKDTIVLPAQRPEYDPAAALLAYVTAAGTVVQLGDMACTDPLFVQRIMTRGGVERLAPPSGQRGGPKKAGRPLTTAQLMSHMRKLLQLAGVEGAESFTTHSFRRGGATALAAAGVDGDRIDALAGWVPGSLMRHHYNADASAAAAAPST